MFLLLIATTVAGNAADVGTPDPSACGNPTNRTAILERGNKLLLDSIGSEESPGAAQAKARAKIAADKLMKRMHQVEEAAHWSTEQAGDFELRVRINPQVHALDQEFITDILRIREVAPRLEASDPVARCEAMVESLALLDRLNTINERKIAAMSQIVDQEAAKLGIDVN